MRIVGVTPIYPSASRPSYGAFVKNIFEGMVTAGGTVTVVSPVSWVQFAGDAINRTKTEVPVAQGITTYRPLYTSVSARLLPWGDLGMKLTSVLFGREVRRTLMKVTGNVDFAYAHFFTAGAACIDWCEDNQVDSILALGESNIADVEKLHGARSFRTVLERFSGVIAVSKSIEDFCRRCSPTLGERLSYIPNAVNTDVFRPRLKRDCRDRLGLPVEGRIAVFVGHFLQRKGSLRVLEAIEKIPGLKGIFLGSGSSAQTPRGPSVLRAAPVVNEDMPLWLCASDVFVLPSLAEGMSNAVLEAMACGLPLVVSDRTFNREFLAEDCAAFVDPESVESIAEGLRRCLRDEKTNRRMAKAALVRSEAFTIAGRIDAILEFYHRVRRCR